MTDNQQELLLVAAIVAASCAYSLWRIYQAMNRRNDPCAGCQGCALREKNEEKDKCSAKKRRKHLANQKK